MCPNFISKFGKVIEKVLGRTLLWSVFDSKQTNVVPVFMIKRIKDAYSNIAKKQVADGKNPVAKVPLYINGDKSGNFILEPLIIDMVEKTIVNKTEEQRLLPL